MNNLKIISLVLLIGLLPKKVDCQLCFMAPIKNGSKCSQEYIKPTSALPVNFIYVNRVLIDSICCFLTNNPTYKLNISIHTIVLGDSLFNYSSSKKIGEVLTQYFAIKKINSEQFKIVPKGENEPLIDLFQIRLESDEKKRYELDRKNQRLEFEIFIH